MLVYLEDFEFVICLGEKCHCVLFKPPGIRNHLTSIHGWPRRRAARAEEPFLTKLILSPNQLVAPDPRDPPIPYLPVSSGIGCHLCSYVCRSPKAMKNHYASDHRGVKFGGAPLSGLWHTKIQVQSYTRAGAYNSCCEVNKGRQLQLETATKILS